jgi:hypothetical protein
MPFDFTDHMSRLIADIAGRCPELAHIDPSRVLTCFSQARSANTRGVYAKILPLRFEGGAEVVEQRGRVWQMPKITFEGRELLYLVYFYLPRFCNLTFEHKLITTFHELYHVSPDFNGDLRRLPGRKYAHGQSRDAFNARVRAMAERYAALPQPDGLLEPLRVDFRTLQATRGPIVGRKMRMPKPIKLYDPAAGQ